MNALKSLFKQLTRYPSAVAGLVIIFVLIGISIYTVLAIPYPEAIRLWRGGVGVWEDNPRNAAPAWINLFRRERLAETIIMDTAADASLKTVQDNGETSKITILYTFNYDFDDFPQELAIHMDGVYQSKPPLVAMYWITPDGREINLGNQTISGEKTYYASQDAKLKRRLKGMEPMRGLFVNPDVDPQKIVKGQYQLRLDVAAFEKDSDLHAKMVLAGTLYGVAGTDHQRRDLTIALLWGTPIALAFGLLAALGTTLTTMVIAAIGTWFGGWTDNLIQRITEIVLVLPTLPILMMIGTFYSRSIWLMLGTTVLLSIFGGAIKNYRSIFMQIKETPYIEAARAYGANNGRIIIHYMVPRIIPMLIPALVTLIPSYVFLEASLAVLGLGDPVLPTWGKIINDAQSNGALFQGYYYWVLQPAALLMLTGLAFSLVGFALDRIFNPRLRSL